MDARVYAFLKARSPTFSIYGRPISKEDALDEAQRSVSPFVAASPSHIVLPLASLRGWFEDKEKVCSTDCDECRSDPQCHSSAATSGAATAFGRLPLRRRDPADFEFVQSLARVIRMAHILKVLRGIHAAFVEEDLLAAWVILEIFGHIEHAAIDDLPNILVILVLCDLFSGAVQTTRKTIRGDRTVSKESLCCQGWSMCTRGSYMNGRPFSSAVGSGSATSPSAIGPSLGCESRALMTAEAGRCPRCAKAPLCRNQATKSSQ